MNIWQKSLIHSYFQQVDEKIDTPPHVCALNMTLVISTEFA